MLVLSQPTAVGLSERDIEEARRVDVHTDGSDDRHFAVGTELLADQVGRQRATYAAAQHD